MGKKYYSPSCSTGVKLGYKLGIPPEDLIIISNTRFETVDRMIKVYGPDDEGWGTFNQEELNYAIQVWESGNLIQPRTLIHEDGRGGFKPGPAELGSYGDRVGLSYSQGLCEDLCNLIKNDKDLKLMQTLEDVGALPELHNSAGEAIKLSTYLEENAEALKSRTELSSNGLNYYYNGDKYNPTPEITVPEGSVFVQIEGAKIVSLPETVKDISSHDNATFVCPTEIQRDSLDRRSYHQIVMSQAEYDKFAASNYSSPVDFIKSECDIFLRNKNGEISDIRGCVKSEITTVEIPDGAVINESSLINNLSSARNIESVIQNGVELDKNSWLRIQDPEALDMSANKTRFYGVKPYHQSEIEVINLPATIKQFDVSTINTDTMPNLKLIVAENPELTIMSSDNANVCINNNLGISIAGAEPESLASIYNSRYPMMSNIYGDPQLTQMIDVKVEKYEETDGFAKMTFRNGNVLYLKEDAIAICHIENEKEVFVSGKECDLSNTSSGVIGNIIYELEREDAQYASIHRVADKEVVNEDENVNTNDTANDRGFSLDDD